MSQTLSKTVESPVEAAEKVRRSIGLGANTTLRISYLPGPGDLFGTYQYWKAGKFDPRVPSIAYSTMFFELCSALHAHGQAVVRDGGLAEAVQDGDFRFDPAPYSPTKGRINYRLMRAKYARACLMAIKQFKPHIVVVASDLEAKYLNQVKRQTPILIYSMHNSLWPMGSPPTQFQSRIRHALLAQQYKFIDAVVCTSHECERQFQAIAGDEIPTFVETPQQIRMPAAKDPLATNPHRLLFLGRVERDKGVFDLLRAFETLKKEFEHLELSFAGNGSALIPLQEAVAASPNESSVNILGHLNSADTHDALSENHILVCPTRTEFTEGLAFVCFEAAAHGTPTVMSTVVPAADLLRDACRIYEADSVDALTTALRGLLENKDEFDRLSQQSHNSASVLVDRNRSWGTQLYRAIVAARKPSG